MLNIRKATLLLALALLCVVTASAKPRTKAEMKSLAKQAINAHLVKQHRATMTFCLKCLATVIQGST